MRQNGMQYKHIFNILDHENVHTVWSTVKRIYQNLAEICITTIKIGSDCAKAIMKKDDQLIKCVALRNKEKTRTNLAKEFKISDVKTRFRTTITR